MDLNGNNEPDANEMVQTDNLNPGQDLNYLFEPSHLHPVHYFH